ncbi:MAG TPA: hypothetical protein VNN10_12265 [Dehalococcoidia bacterium]|nr:hypothetical protein [Dehalococcoidia bacterium]
MTGHTLLAAGALAASPARAEGPDTSQAFAELVFAGAPLKTSPSPAFEGATAFSSTIGSLPAGRAAAPASESVPQPPGVEPPLPPQLPDVPNPFDWFGNLDPRK